MPRKTYIRPPNDDYAPDNNIQLGHIWRDPRDPGSFIGAPLLIPVDLKVNYSYKDSWVMDLGRESNIEAGIWAKIFQLSSIITSYNSSSDAGDSTYRIPRLDTYSIEPTAAYVEASVASVPNDAFRSGPNLYMITGVKIARGGEGLKKESKDLSVSAMIGANIAAGGEPTEVVGEVGYLKSTRNNQEFKSTSDFVLAYRLREIFYEKNTLKTREYNKGAVLGESMDVVPTTDEPGCVIEKVRIGKNDVEVEGEAFTLTEDTDEEWVIII